VHSAKQEITETIKFLTWLKLTHGRTIASCVQADVDAWLADGPTTRHAIRTFFVWAMKNRTCTNITIGFRQAKTVPLLTQGQRLAMLKACLTDDIDTLSYRVASTLLLLYAQPVVKIAAMKSTDVILTPDGLRLSLGEGDPAPVPEPFASLLTEHLASRPNMRTGSSSGSEWLFPGYRPGHHMHPNTLMERLREIGINLLGARNASLRALVKEVPAPLVAEMLGYSYQVTQKHATAAAEPWSRYPRREATRIMTTPSESDDTHAHGFQLDGLPMLARLWRQGGNKGRSAAEASTHPPLVPPSNDHHADLHRPKPRRNRFRAMALDSGQSSSASLSSFWAFRQPSFSLWQRDEYWREKGRDPKHPDRFPSSGAAE
jgi:hypothetical protein